jgi:hypothetical protein
MTWNREYPLIHFISIVFLVLEAFQTNLWKILSGRLRILLWIWRNKLSSDFWWMKDVRPPRFTGDDQHNILKRFAH